MCGMCQSHKYDCRQGSRNGKSWSITYGKSCFGSRNNPIWKKHSPPQVGKMALLQGRLMRPTVDLNATHDILTHRQMRLFFSCLLAYNLLLLLDLTLFPPFIQLLHLTPLSAGRTTDVSSTQLNPTPNIT